MFPFGQNYSHVNYLLWSVAFALHLEINQNQRGRKDVTL